MDKEKDKKEKKTNRKQEKQKNEMKTKVYRRGEKSQAGSPNTDAFRTKVARSLAVERMMKQVSQDDLAEQLGTSKSSISRIESGRQNLTLDYVSDIAYALGKEPVLELRDPPIEYGDKSVYELKMYDETLIEFSMERTPSLVIKILKINEDRRDVFPLDLELTPDGLYEWLSHRTIPKHREKFGGFAFW